MNTSLSKAVITGKCPRCRKGDLFVHGAYSFKDFTKMHDRCPVCDQKYQVEPGFFFGAMYVSYAFTVALVVNIGLILHYGFGDPDVMVYIAAVTISVIVLLPLIFRYSRILFLYWFGRIPYDKKYATN